MAATTARTTPAEGEKRFLIRNVDWQGYQALLGALGQTGVRITYDQGSVELMAPLFIHERFKKRIAAIIETVAGVLGIPMLPAGSTTFSREDLDRGLEPDECYYLAAAKRLRDSERIDLQVDPPPDLVVEIDITSSSLDREGVYAALGVPEVWRFDGEALVVLLRSDAGAYVPSDTSAAFPWLPLDAIRAFLFRDLDRRDDIRWAEDFRAWVRDEILPLYRAGGGEPAGGR